jgi:hypothetical protein
MQAFISFSDVEEAVSDKGRVGNCRGRTGGSSASPVNASECWTWDIAPAKPAGTRGPPLSDVSRSECYNEGDRHGGRQQHKRLVSTSSKEERPCVFASGVDPASAATC